jgi:hypothetical protein
VTLPLAAPSKESSEAARDRLAGAGEIPQSHAPSPWRLRDLRVLLVDDEPDARNLLGLILTSYEAEVRDCASAAEALQILDECVLAAMRRRIWVLIYTASPQGHGIEGSGSCIPEPSQPYLVSGLHHLGRGNRSNKF